jgi:hypothetical protein
VALDKPRYLDRRAGRSYTEDELFKMCGEPEPVSADVQRRITEEARRRFENERAYELAKRDARSRTARLRNVMNEASRLGVDGARELAAIDRQLDLLNRKCAQQRSQVV